MWRGFGARTEEEAYGYWVQQFRRLMGVTIVHEFVRLRIRRVPFLGVPREFVRDRARGRRVVAQGWCRQEVRRLTVVMRATSLDTRPGRAGRMFVALFQPEREREVSER